MEITILCQRHLIKEKLHEPYRINTTIQEFLIENFSIKHSYFLSPITCHTILTSYNSPNQRDQIFGSQGSAFPTQVKRHKPCTSPKQRTNPTSHPLGQINRTKR
jgi:hypothetical protein